MRAETRHQLKQDKFNKVTIGAAEATVDWSVEHRKTVAVSAAVLIVVIAAAGWIWYHFNQQNDAASLAMDQAVRTLQTQVRPPGVPAQPEYPSFASGNERASTAHSQFQAIADKYPHTHSAEFARYFVAVTDADMGNTAAAEREFQSAASSRDKNVAALANFGLASLYRNTNRTVQAIDIYKKLIDKPAPTVGKSTAEIALAETYQDAGQPAQARRTLEQVQKENPGSEIAQIVSQKLQDLK